MPSVQTNRSENVDHEQTAAACDDKIERKRLQNRLAQRTYRRNQRQRFQALQAAVTWPTGLNMLPTPPEQIPGPSSATAPSAVDLTFNDPCWPNPSQPSGMPIGISDNRTPLHVAAASGSAEITKLLLDRGANIDSQDASLKTALHIAAENGHYGVAELLLSESADVAKTDILGRTALFPALEGGGETLVQLLLDATADINVVDAAGRSALHLAVAHGSVSMVTLLLDFGANVEARAERQNSED